MNKKIVMLLVVGLAVFFLLAVVSSAFATGTPPGGTPAPSSGAPGGTAAPSSSPGGGTAAPSSSGGSVSGGTTSSGGTTGAKTGADLFLFAGVGTALLGTGYFLIRKVKA